MASDAGPSKKLIPDYLRSTFDPQKATVNDLVGILIENKIGIPARRRKQELVALYDEHIYKNRQKLINGTLRANYRDVSSKTPLGYKSSYARESRSPTIKRENSQEHSSPTHKAQVTTLKNEGSKRHQETATDMRSSLFKLESINAMEEYFSGKDNIQMTRDAHHNLRSQGDRKFPSTPTESNTQKDPSFRNKTLAPKFADDFEDKDDETIYSHEDIDISPSELGSVSRALSNLAGNILRRRFKRLFRGGMDSNNEASQYDNYSHSSFKRGSSRKKESTMKRSSILKIILFIVIPISFALSIWADDFYKNYEYCADTKFKRDGYNLFFKVFGDCRKCPRDAVCSSKKVLFCSNSASTLKPALLTYLIDPKYIPFPFAESRCINDPNIKKTLMLKNKHIDLLAKISERLARVWAGRIECGKIDPKYKGIIEKSRKTNIKGIPFSVALEQVRKITKVRKWSNDYFNDTWNEFLRRLVEPYDSKDKRDSVYEHLSIRMISDDSQRIFVSSQKPILPFACKFRKLLWSIISQNLMTILTVSFITLCGWFLYESYSTSWSHAKIIAAVTETIVDILSSNGKFSNLTVAEMEQIFLPIILPGSELKIFNGQCIDDPRTGLPQWILCNSHERESVWSKIHAQIKKNPCIRETLISKHGESQVFWKWIGTGAMEIPESSVK